MVKRYDAGLLSDYGGGNVEWWQDYIRAEIDRCNDYWEDEIAAKEAELVELQQCRDHWKISYEELRQWKESAMTVLSKIDLQAIGKEIGVKLGEDISPKVLPAIKELKRELEEAERESDRLTMIAEEISKQATIEHYNMEDARKSLSVIQKRHALELAATQARAERAERALEPVKNALRFIDEDDGIDSVSLVAETLIVGCRDAIRLANAPESVTSGE